MESASYVKVLIIGAGVSGLKAAQTLLSNSKDTLQREDILILEAQNRIGGRIWTDRESSKLGISYDLGASWFHDSLTNSVLWDAIDEEDDSQFDVNKDVYYDDKEENYYAKNIEGPYDSRTLRIKKILQDLEEYIELYFHDDFEAADISLKEITYKFLDKYGKLLTQEQKELCPKIIRYYELWYGITWDVISARFGVMGHQGRDLFNRKGYDFIIKKLANKIGHDRIVLSESVTYIDRKYTGNKGNILIKTSNGRVITTDYLVVTVPQSILALNNSSPEAITWEPPLPTSITDALKKVHFGALGKVIFEFDSIFWDNNENRFFIADNSSEEAYTAEESAPLKTLPKPFTYPLFAVNISASANKEISGGSLCILTQSPLTEYMELHKDQAWNYFGPMLRKLKLEDKEFRDPINVITSSWTKNPYVRGSYSSLHTNDDPSDLIINLSGEHANCGLSATNIRFAGEHTISDGAGCVHGAYNSGKREAEWILNHMGI